MSKTPRSRHAAATAFVCSSPPPPPHTNSKCHRSPLETPTRAIVTGSSPAAFARAPQRVSPLFAREWRLELVVSARAAINPKWCKICLKRFSVLPLDLAFLVTPIGLPDCQAIFGRAMQIAFCRRRWTTSARRSAASREHRRRLASPAAPLEPTTQKQKRARASNCAIATRRHSKGAHECHSSALLAGRLHNDYRKRRSQTRNYFDTIVKPISGYNRGSRAMRRFVWRRLFAQGGERRLLTLAMHEI